jgi:hypothetical protein
MASEEGLKILLKGEVQDFLKDMKSAKDAIFGTASAASDAVKSFLGLSSAADDTSKSLNEEATAATKAGQANASVGKFIRQMTYERKSALIEMRNGTNGWKLEKKAIEDTIPAYDKLQKQTAKTGAVTTSLNRIVQDAPFGYIAIQNNLTELFGSYQSLTKQLGSSQAAFKALASSLIGAGGVGLAFSAVTSLITFAVQKYGSLEKSIMALSGAYDKQAQLQDQVNKAIAENIGQVEGEITKVGALSKIILDESNNRQTRVNALKELKKEYPGYFDQVNLDSSLTKTLTASQTKLIEVLKRHAQAKAILAQIEKNYTEILTVQNDNVIESASAWQKFSSLVINGGNVAAVASELAQQGAENQKKSIDALNKSNESLLAQYDKLIKQDAINNTFRDPDKPEKAGKHIKTVADILKELNAALAATDAQAQLFGGTFDNLANEKIKALNKAFDDLVKLGLKPTAPELKAIADQINRLSAGIIGVKPLTTILSQPLGKAIKTTRVKPLTTEELAKILGVSSESKLLLEPKVKVEPIYQTTPALENLDKFAAQFSAKMKKISTGAKDEFKKNFIVWGDALTSGLAPALANLSAALQQGISNTLSGFGEGLGKAISGGGFTGALNAIINSMSQFIISFGKQLIEAGTLALIAQKSLIANPYLAIAAGIGAVAIGAALKNSVPAFATGGKVTGPTLAMVGDNPSGVEYMIPKEVLDKVGGGNNGFIAETRLSGSDILVVVKRAGLNQNRING